MISTWRKHELIAARMAVHSAQVCRCATCLLRLPWLRLGVAVIETVGYPN